MAEGPSRRYDSPLGAAARLSSRISGAGAVFASCQEFAMSVWAALITCHVTSRRFIEKGKDQQEVAGAPTSHCCLTACKFCSSADRHCMHHCHPS